MQGQQSAVGSLPEVIGFDHGSTSSGDTDFDQQMCWTSVGNSTQTRVPDFLLSSTSDANTGHTNAANCQRLDFCGWDFGESSSRAGRDETDEDDQKGEEHEWSAPMNVCTQNMLNLDQQYQSSNDEDANETLLVNNSESQMLPQDLNMNIEVDDDDEDDDNDDDDDEDCRILEYPHVFRSDGSRNDQIPFASSSSNPFGAASDGRRLSCKRKTLERNAIQPFEGGSTSNATQGERNPWLTLPSGQEDVSSSILAIPEENNPGFNLPEQVNPRLGLGFGQATSDNSSLLDSSGTRGSSRRNFRLRINTAYQASSVPNTVFSPDTNNGNTRLIPPNNLLVSARGSVSTDPQSVAVNASSSRTSSHFRWSESASVRNMISSSSFGSEVTNAAQHEAFSSTRVPRTLPDYPMFEPPNEARTLLQNAPNWSGNAGSTSRSSSGVGVHSGTPSWVPNQSPSQYPRRLPEYVSRSFGADTDSGGQNNIYMHPSSSSSQVTPPLGSGTGSHSRHARLLERRIDASFPYSMRALAAGGEGRSRLVSEMRNVLDLVRRGEGLRFEDVMMLDQSGFFGMAEIHDRHRDMRLDVDNMSYEELLALEERIGNVSTGLTEESILKQLKQRIYVSTTANEEEEIEPCCVCQEAYSDGEVVGLLECGHDFHGECIKQWLMNKNLCPICKTTGLTK